jgi:uncharacterized protein with WD repeat
MATTKNKSTVCECGGTYSLRGKRQHFRSKRHRLHFGDYVETEQDRKRREQRTNYMRDYRKTHRDGVKKNMLNYYYRQKQKNKNKEDDNANDIIRIIEEGANRVETS